MPSSDELDRRFFGRRAELSRLDGALHRALEGYGSVAVIRGDPGIGKTRLAEEVASVGRAAGACVAWGRCFDEVGTPAFWPWTELLTNVVRSLGTVPSDLDPHGELASLVPELARRIDPAGSSTAEGCAPPQGRGPSGPDTPLGSTGRPGEANSPDGGGLGEGDAAEARFRLFQSFGTLLARLAEVEPLVLVIDDVQWADTASLAVIEFVARHLTPARIFVMVTVRGDDIGREDPVGRTLGVLLRTPGSESIELSGLSPEESRAMLVGLLDQPAVDRHAEELYGRTEGNPLFLVELARLVDDVGGGRPRQPPAGAGSGAEVGADVRAAVGADVGAGAPPLSATLRELIGRRLARLSEEDEAVLRLAAVVGREFGPDLLELASGRPLEDVLDALERAERARLVVGAGVGAFRFWHPLIREVLLADMAAVQRARLHRRVAEAIETLAAGDLEPVLSEVAFHFARATSTGTAERAVDYGTRAARRAVRLHAFEEAIANYDLVLPFVRDRASIGMLLLELGEALNRAGKLARSETVFEQAAATARELLAAGSPQAATMLARAALGATVIMVSVQARAEHARLLEEALDALDRSPVGDQPALRIELLTRLAGALAYSSAVDRRDGLLDQALALAEELEDPSVLTMVLSVRSLTAWRRADLDGRVAVADRVTSLAARSGDRNLMIEAQRLRVVALLDSGEMAGLDQALADHAAMASAGFGIHHWRSVMWRTMRLLVDGRYADAEANMAQALELANEVGHPDAFVWFAAQTLQLRRDQGRLEELEASVRGLVDDQPEQVVWRSVLAAVCAELGATGEALDHVARVAADLNPLGTGLSGFEPVLALVDGLAIAVILADAVIEAQDPVQAGLLLAALEPYAAHGVMAGPAVAFLGCVAHRLGGLAALCGDDAAAQRHFEAAALRYERMSAAPWLARLAYDRALASVRTATAAKEPIAALLSDAAGAARRLGMSGLAARADALAAAIGVNGETRAAPATAGLPAAVAPAAVAPPGVAAVSPEDARRYETLSRREREVLRLIAAGQTNPQIADALFVANKTVMHHAASIYRKLGVSGRAQAAAFVTRVEGSAMRP